MGKRIITYAEIPKIIENQEKEFQGCPWIIFPTDVYDFVEDNESQDMKEQLTCFTVSPKKKIFTYFSWELCCIAWRPQLLLKDDKNHLLQAVKHFNKDSKFYFGTTRDIRP